MKDRLYQIYTSEFKNVDTLYLRPEIKNILLDSDKIKRFTGNDLPEGSITDTVFTHTLRCISFADSMSLGVYSKGLLKLILTLHDLPEVASLLEEGKTSDVTSPEKEVNKNLETKISNKELEVAKNIFNSQELLLYEWFEESGNFLKGKVYKKEYANFIGILAQLIDKIDANLTLHFNLSKWVNDHDPDLKTLIPEKSLTFAFRQYPKFKEKLEIIEDKEFTSFAISLLKNQIDIIKKLWK